MKPHFELLADYNRWMNAKVYEAAGRLDAEALSRDRGAFFGSVFGTLNHLAVADIIWLQRFARHPACGAVLGPVSDLPAPTGLDQLLFEDFDGLSARRAWLDERICSWVGCLSETDLDFVLDYRNVKGVPANKKYASLMLHFFNHQTHHRGQVTTLLSQAGMDVGVTDLLALIPDDVQG